MQDIVSGAALIFNRPKKNTKHPTYFCHYGIGKTSAQVQLCTLTAFDYIINYNKVKCHFLHPSL